jgi:cell division protein FtsX
MNSLAYFGKLLLVLGAGIAVLGLVLLIAARIKGVGQLPGDFYLQRKNFTFYFPLTTSILISLVVSLLAWVISKK